MAEATTSSRLARPSISRRLRTRAAASPVNLPEAVSVYWSIVRISSPPCVLPICARVALCLLALASLLAPQQMRLIPIACVFFAFARLVYWRGYLRSGTLGRAPGVQLTFTLNIALLLIAVVLFARSLLAGGM